MYDAINTCPSHADFIREAQTFIQGPSFISAVFSGAGVDIECDILRKRFGERRTVYELKAIGPVPISPTIQKDFSYFIDVHVVRDYVIYDTHIINHKAVHTLIIIITHTHIISMNILHILSL